MIRLALAFAIVLTAAAPPAADERPGYDAWLRAVERHDPGRIDESVLLVGSWPQSDLRRVLEGLRAAVARIKHAPDQRSETVAAINRTIRRAAMLHADIALLLPFRDAWSTGQDALTVRDGLVIGTDRRNFHWDFARLVLDTRLPTPAEDSLARLWYEATTAALLEQTNWVEALPHVARALAHFPRDGRFYAYLGAVHETFAAPRIQNARTAQPLSAGEVTVDRESVELREAVRYLDRALDLDPQLIEARVRLGRVFSLQGRHEDALAALELALPQARTPVLRFYNLMFLGREQQLSNRREEARRSFAAALALFPGAQSARLALAEMSWSAGDRDDALQHTRILTRPLVETTRGDPWWVYYERHFPSSDELLADLRQAVAADRTP